MNTPAVHQLFQQPFINFVQHPEPQQEDRRQQHWDNTDLNHHMYQRRLQLSAEENPYKNDKLRRRAQMNLFADTMRTNDQYTKLVGTSDNDPDTLSGTHRVQTPHTVHFPPRVDYPE